MRRVGTLLVVLLIPGPAPGIPNPAALYGEKLGYEYRIRQTPQGERGVVVVAPGVEFDAWDFFKGKVGNDYSYGAQHGYDTLCVSSDMGAYRVEYAVCVPKTPGRQSQDQTIPLLELMEKNGEPLLARDAGKRGMSWGSSEPPADQDGTVDAYGMTGGRKTEPLPSEFDWRNKDGHAYIGPIRDQGSCGSCYAFSAAACAEGIYNWATGSYDSNRAEFSESFIMWCLGRLPQYNSHFYGCGGADWDYEEMEALVQYGVCSQADFPYTETDPGSCTHWNDPRTVFWSWHRVACNDVEAIKTAIMTYGVVNAAVYALSAFQGYSGGIYADSYTNCSDSPCYYTYTQHAIALVGWDDDPPEGGGGCWILRNSWDASWGESGYMRIRYTSARVACEACYLNVPCTSQRTPLAWLHSYGFTNDYEAADTNDADGDGLLTWQEYVTGTDPTNPGSVFAVIEQGYARGSNYVTWYGTTNSGVTNAFRMRRSTNLAGNAWDVLADNIPRNSSGTNTWWGATQAIRVIYQPAAPNSP